MDAVVLNLSCILNLSWAMTLVVAGASAAGLHASPMALRRCSLCPLGKIAAGPRQLARSALTLLLVGLAIGLGSSSAFSAVICKPLLSIKNVREIRTSTMPQPWIWKATISVDRSYCATKSGSFEIDFVRIKEYSPDIQFTQKFEWVSEQLDVTIDLAADEAILDYRIGFIAPCVCREFPK
jgi:hypothetical protein